MAQQIQLRRDTSANWTSVNPTLAIGEIGIETNTLKLKIGDGATNWNSLIYYGGGVTSVSGSSPISSSGGTTPSISIANAFADGLTKGAASFNSGDFNDNGSGLISIDYTNGQSSSSSTNGFLTSGDWTTFNGKVTSVSGASPISSSGGSTPSISIQNAVADGSTKGAAAFNASDFDSSAGVISIDYTNGQAASASTKGFLTSANWTTFNSKQATITTGAVDNAVLRADGTGGATLQNSGLIIEDTIESFAVTGDATTDIITATGSAFANNQPVRFTALTGGTGLNTTTNYYVINVSGATFQVSTSIAGPASLFTTNITAGTLLTGHSVSANVTLSENTTATNSDLVLTPKGTGAFIIGPKPDGTATGGNARGQYAVDLGTRAAATNVASGNYSFTVGRGNTASGSQNIAIGGQSVASGSQNAACLGGETNVASANFSTAVGGQTCTASGEFSITLGGRGARADRYAMMAHAANQFSSQGDAQRVRFVLRCKTTTNAAVEMALDGSTTYLGISSGKVIACTINISGVKSDGTAVAHYIRQYAVKNVSGTSTQVYAPVTIGTDNAAGTSIALSANDADDTLRIAVTGIAAETWRWVASVDAVEIGYGT